jgi:hypothetical protein
VRAVCFASVISVAGLACRFGAAFYKIYDMPRSEEALLLLAELLRASMRSGSAAAAAPLSGGARGVLLAPYPLLLLPDLAYCFGAAVKQYSVYLTQHQLQLVSKLTDV